ncbi:MAG: glycosyltransferase family 2 protein [Verrucomicrobiota bacterium]|jgi:glycosyltransferase involved in cell wall biosynthesis
MLFSVVTPSLNCGEFISNNLASVRKQGFGPGELEHWVIDGGSTDGTLDILKREPQVKWISEPDKGLSDAVNKGIQKSKGDWIIWLNADDLLADEALKVFLEYTRRQPDIRIFCGDETILRYDGSVEQTVPGWDYNLKDLLGTRTGMNQPSTFVHSEVYQKVGLLDVADRYAMDYEWLVRAMHHYQCVPIPEVLTYYRRRKDSITDAHLNKQFEVFLAIRRKYRQPYLSRAEFRIRFYLYTEPLRRIRWIRRVVRRFKGLLGVPPLNPMN